MLLLVHQLAGILTLLYAVNSDYEWINTLFEQGCPKIFKKRVLGGLIGPYYNNHELKKFITHVVGDYKLSDIKKLNDGKLNILVPTLDFTLTQPRVFDNINVDPNMDMDLTTIALATSAAPTYFPAIEYIWKMQEGSLEEALHRPVNEQIYLLTQQAMLYQDEQRSKLKDLTESRKSVLIDGRCFRKYSGSYYIYYITF